jgi:cytoskeleton protein RodZ
MSEEAVSVDGLSAGALLRQAREAAGLHLATLAANLKVPPRKLEALEEDRYDLLPDAVFVRALASSVCRTLKMDPQPVLQRLPQTASPRLVQEGEGINTPFHSPKDGPSPGFLDQFSRPVVFTVAALLLGALVLVFLPMVQHGYDSMTEPDKSDPVMPPPGAAATVPSTSAPVETVLPAPAGATAPATPAPAPAPAVTAAAPAPGLATAAVAAAPRNGASAAAPQDGAAGPLNARGIVAFRTKGQSWIQVTDATGATVFQRLLEPGETAAASGALPLTVTIGNVQATEVQVRGKPFNMAAVSRDNVARFEVK